MRLLIATLLCLLPTVAMAQPYSTFGAIPLSNADIQNDGTNWLMTGIVPQTDSTYDLGSTGVRWANVWTDAITVGAAASSGSLAVSADATIGDDLTVTGSTIMQQRIFLVEGDSLSNDGGDFPAYFYAISADMAQMRYVNDATGGNRTDQMVSDDISGSYVLGNDQDGIFSVCGGTNDLGQGRTDAQIYADLQTLWANAKADGYRVIAYTVPPATGYTVPQEAYRVALNTSIKSDKSLYDWLVDLSTIYPDPSDTTYYQVDGTHFNTTASLKTAKHLQMLLEYEPYELRPYGTTSTGQGAS